RPTTHYLPTLPTRRSSDLRVPDPSRPGAAMVSSSVTAADRELLPRAHPGGVRVDGVGRPAAAAHGGDVVTVERLDVVHAAPERRSEEHTSELQSHLKLVCR